MAKDMKQLLNLEPNQLNSMNQKELRKVVNQLARNANRRVNVLQKHGYQTQKPDFTTKDKNLNQLRSEYARVAGFLRKKTSSYTGRKKLEKAMAERIGGRMSDEQSRDFWDSYDRIRESEPYFLQMYGSERMQQFIYQTITESGGEATTVDLVMQGLDAINEWYSESMMDENESPEGGDFFEFFGF